MIQQKHSKNKNYYMKVSEELKKNDQKTPKLLPTTKNPGSAVVSLLNFVIQQIFWKYHQCQLSPLTHSWGNTLLLQRYTRFFQKVRESERYYEASLLVRLDLKSLYTNIPNNKDIKAKPKKKIQRKKDIYRSEGVS